MTVPILLGIAGLIAAGIGVLKLLQHVAYAIAGCEGETVGHLAAATEIPPACYIDDSDLHFEAVSDRPAKGFISSFRNPSCPPEYGECESVWEIVFIIAAALALWVFTAVAENSRKQFRRARSFFKPRE